MFLCRLTVIDTISDNGILPSTASCPLGAARFQGGVRFRSTTQTSLQTTAAQRATHRSTLKTDCNQWGRPPQRSYGQSVQKPHISLRMPRTATNLTGCDGKPPVMIMNALPKRNTSCAASRMNVKAGGTLCFAVWSRIYSSHQSKNPQCHSSHRR
jgi:hypothetical protein